MPRDQISLVYVGLKHYVLAFDRKSGVEVWRAELKPRYKSTATFVNVVRDRDGVFATCAGELFSLDPRTGTLLWQEPLKGLGTGLVSIATDLGGASSTAIFEESVRQAKAAASAGAAT